MENPQTPVETNTEQESVLLDVADMSGYDKSLRRARGWLYVLAAMQACIGVYELCTTEDATVGKIAFGIDLFVAVVFLGLTIWSYKKPAPAFLTSLIFYIVFIVLLCIVDPANIFRGILVKILFVIALVRAYKDAKEIEEMKQTFGTQG